MRVTLLKLLSAKWCLTPFMLLLLGNQAAWASPLGDRYVAVERTVSTTIVGYGSTPLAACGELYKAWGVKNIISLEVLVEGAAIDHIGQDTFPDFMPGPVCYAIQDSVNGSRNYWYVNEVIDQLGIDFFKNQGSDCSSVTNNGTNPVNIGTGNKLQRELDYESNPLVFKRTYNNTSRPLGLGSGWRGSFDRFIKNDAQYFPNSAYMYRENGAVLRYALISGNWQIDADIPDRLTELKDASGIQHWLALHRSL